MTDSKLAKVDAWMTIAFLTSLFWSIWMPVLGEVRGLNLRMNQVVLPIVVVYLLWSRREGMRFWPRYTVPLFITWLAFLFWTSYAAASHTLTSHAEEKPIVAIGRVFLIAVNLVTYGAAYLLVLRTRDLRRAADLFVILGTAMAVLTVLLTIAVSRGMNLPPDTGTMVWDWFVRDGKLVLEQLPRLVGVPNKVTFLAGIAVMSLALAGEAARWRYLVCFLVCVFGVFVGVSRGALVGFAIGIGVVFLVLAMRGAFREMLRIVAVTLAAILLATGVFAMLPDHGGPLTATFRMRVGQMTHAEKYVQGTVTDRLDLWSNLLDDVRRNPFRGRGMDSYQKYTRVITTENFFLEVLHASGLVGFIPLICVIGAICWRAWGVVRAGGAFAIPTLALLGGYLTVLTGSMTNSLWGAGLFWAMLGVLAATFDVAQSTSVESIRLQHASS